ncbi:MAG: hypothetical protein KBS59_06060 [Clostridiales bacterium]|nr:hypothetical protein [Clostridiales bacterium]
MAVIFNEDPNHYIFTRAEAGVKSICESELREFIRKYGDTNISDFLVCVNASMPFYPTKKQKSAIDRFCEWEASGELERRPDDKVAGCVGLLRDAYARGVNIIGIWLDEIRKCGMRDWVSFRMNDIHDTEKPDAFLPSDFYKAHPEYTRVSYRRPATHPEYALDYSHAQVREHFLSLISETLETYDVSGIELDYMREPFCFAIGREQAGLEIMTEFIGEVVSEVKKAEERYGHKILVGVRVPASPRDCMLLGFDVFEWIRRGYVTNLFVTPHWSSSDGNMPIDLWKSIISGTGVRLAAGLEFLIDAYNRRGRKYLGIDFDSAVGFACAYDALGADDTYLFNFMGSLKNSDAGDVLANDNYMKLLKTLGDREKMIASPRRNIVSFFDTWIPGEKARKVLPITVCATDGDTEFEAMRIPVGKIEKGRKVTLCLGFERGLSQGDDAMVYAACQRCRLLGKTDVRYPAYDDMDYYLYEIENDGALPCVIMAEVGALRGKAVIHWAEIRIE